MRNLVMRVIAVLWVASTIVSAQTLPSLEDEALAQSEQAQKLMLQGRPADAVPLLKDSLQKLAQAFPSDNPQTRPMYLGRSGITLGQLGFAYSALGQQDQAVKFFEQQAAHLREVLRQSDSLTMRFHTAQALQNLAQHQINVGQAAEGVTTINEAFAILKQLPTTDADVVTLVAGCLSTHGLGLKESGRFDESRQSLQLAIDLREKLYPREKFPLGRRELALAYSNLGVLEGETGRFSEAEVLLTKSIDMQRRLLPKEKFPHGHPDLARALNNLAVFDRMTGRWPAARDLYVEALAIYQAAYPLAKFPYGHADLARTAHNLGRLHAAMGETAKARVQLATAVEMYEVLDQQSRRVVPHPETARSRASYGMFLREQGQLEPAFESLAKSLEARLQLFPESKYSNGHPDLADSLNETGLTCKSLRRYELAVEYLSRALAMNQRLFGTGKSHDGTWRIARSENNLASALHRAGRLPDAEQHYAAAVELLTRQYPTERFPHGHPDMAVCYTNLGRVQIARGENTDRGVDSLLRASAMYRQLAEVFTAEVAESEALNLLESLPTLADDLLSAWPKTKRDPHELYDNLWGLRGLVMEITSDRWRRLARTESPDVVQLLTQYQQARRDLAAQYLAIAGSSAAARPAIAKALTEAQTRKENLERELSQQSVAFQSQREQAQATPTELAKVLHPGSVFVDFILSTRHDESAASGPRYTAFVMAPGQTVRLLDLGPAKPIEESISLWRKDLIAGRASRAAGQLRQQLWEKLEPLLPADTTAIYLAPDGAFATLPWSALPGKQPRTVLLEEYLLVTVPHGRLLWRGLRQPAKTNQNTDRLLSVGGVRYDAPAERKTNSFLPAGVTRPLHNAPYLKETLMEAASAEHLFGTPRTNSLSGAAASGLAVLELLPEVNYAVLSTHSAIDPEAIRDTSRVIDRQESFSSGERISAVQRNPLLKSQLLMAGANLSPQIAADGRVIEDGAVLTGEQIAALRLDQLRLVVLSVCSGALGENVAQEGTFGLPRAFHQAGARNVVTTLWPIDDAATRKLMTLFFWKLWKEDLPPAQALREAQLVMLHHADQLEAWNPQQPLQLDPRKSRTRVPTGARYWASFVLSGDGL